MHNPEDEASLTRHYSGFQLRSNIVCVRVRAWSVTETTIRCLQGYTYQKQ